VNYGIFYYDLEYICYDTSINLCATWFKNQDVDIKGTRRCKCMIESVVIWSYMYMYIVPGSPLMLSSSTLAVPHLATRNLAKKGAFAAL
jgi:hypothetical protein